MRDRSNTISPMAYIPRRIDVGVVSEPTAPASKHLPMPLFLLYPSAARAGDGGIGRTDQRNRNAYQHSQQPHARGKILGRVAFPSDKPLRVFQGNASTRLLRYEHGPSGFTGKHLSLRTGFNAPVNAMLLVHCAAVALAFENGPQVWPFISIAPRDSRSGSDVTTEPALCWFLDFRQRDRHTHTGVPFPVFTEDFRALVQLGPR